MGAERSTTNPSACTLAYWHHPVFSSGKYGNNRQMAEIWRLLQTAGAEVVLTGHDHDYERFAPMDADGHADAQGVRSSSSAPVAPN
jgi:alkaline phosphatase